MQTQACSVVPANRPSCKSLETQAVVAWWRENPSTKVNTHPARTPCSHAPVTRQATHVERGSGGWQAASFRLGEGVPTQLKGSVFIHCTQSTSTKRQNCRLEAL